ncbi:hypothetical protein PI125_g15157 [Phytophthora idaei]|nr:hypothetical protein PI125_g15157 [Phytophthora idaei]
MSGFCREDPVLPPTIVVESDMTTLYTKLKGAANVYTMDHRGTGRSTVLECSAAQAVTSGSPTGNTVEPSEVPSCAKALERKYGDLASFSTMSAAKDLVTLVSEFSDGKNTIVYGTSYGSLLVERIIHLDPPFAEICRGLRGPYFSELLYYLIVFSEGWERPQPSMEEMTKRFTDYGIAAETCAMPPLYCAFSKEKSKACN